MKAWLDKTFLQLRSLQFVRKQLRLERFKDLIVVPNDGSFNNENDDESYYDPLICQIGKFICATNIGNEYSSTNTISQDCFDIKRIDASSRLGTAFSGVSRFLSGNKTEKKLISDFQTVIFFSVGGITFNEAYKLQRIFASAGKRVIIGSTSICTRESLYSNLIKK